LVHLNISDLPSYLVLKWWTKIGVETHTNSDFWGCDKNLRYSSLMEYFKEVSIMVAETFDDYDDQRHKLINERDMLWVNKFSIDGDV